MPARHRPKAPPPPPPSDAERFARAVRDSEEADRRAAQAVRDRLAAEVQRKLDAEQHAARLAAAQAAHRRAVEMVKEATRSGKGAVEADQAWRAAKAELIEVETGRPPAWAPRPPEPAPEPEAGSPDSGSTDPGD
jgi:hypothetical protein